jgi:hypothetical protein
MILRLLIACFTLFSSFTAIAQSNEVVFKANECSLSCGANFNYNYKIRISNDTISIIGFGGQAINQYIITSSNSVWKVKDFDGFSRYKTVNISTLSPYDIKIFLRKGKGTMKIFDNEICEMKIEIELD